MFMFSRFSGDITRYGSGATRPSLHGSKECYNGFCDLMTLSRICGWGFDSKESVGWNFKLDINKTRRKDHQVDARQCEQSSSL